MNGDFPAGGTVPGYNCPMCHMWVQYGWQHQCVGWTPQPWPTAPQGWSCPHCHKAHAPWVQTCPDLPATFVSTIGSAGNTDPPPTDNK